MKRMHRLMLLCFPDDGEDRHEEHEAYNWHENPHGKKNLGEHYLKDWAAKMENVDGTTGAHWTMEQTDQVMQQKGIHADPEEFWCAMNMIYSDYAAVAGKLGVNSVDFYADMAVAFLEDKDAVHDRLRAYYTHVVKT